MPNYSILRPIICVLIGVGNGILIAKFNRPSLVIPKCTPADSQFNSQNKFNGIKSQNVLPNGTSTNQTPRILCYINTFPMQYKTNAIHMQNTWARRCTKTWFTSVRSHPGLPVMELPLKQPEIKQHLWVKMRAALRFIYRYADDFDYFYKADDDTYTVVENLQLALRNRSPVDPFMTGYRWPLRLPQGYFSGGAGYLLSRETLKRLVEWSIDKHPDCPTADEALEDVKMSRCGHAVGVKLYDTLDERGQSLFYPYQIQYKFNEFKKTSTPYHYPPAGRQRDYLGFGENHISFHYCNGKMAYVMEFLLYYIQPTAISH